MIQSSPIQVYTSAFPFLPRNSILRTAYADQVKHLKDVNLLSVSLGLDDAWDSTLRTLAPGININCIAISGDSTFLAGTNADVKELSVWNLKSGHQVGQLKSDIFKTWARTTMAFLPGNRLLGCYPDKQRLWSVDATFSHAEAVDIHEGSSLDWDTLSFSPDGARLAGALVEEGTHSLAIWIITDAGSADASCGTSHFAFAVKHRLDSEVSSIAWSPDSQSISVSLQRYVEIFTFISERAVLSPAAQLPCVTDATVWSSRGDLIACSPADNFSSPSVFCLAPPDSDGQRAVQCRWNLVPPGESSPGGVGSIVFSPVDNTTILVARGAEVQLWKVDIADSDIYSGSLISIVSCGKEVNPVAFALSGTRIICRRNGYPGGILVLDANAGTRTESSPSTADTPRSAVTQLAFSPLGHVLAIVREDDDVVYIHDPADGSLVKKVTTHGYGPSVGIVWGTETTILAVTLTQATMYDIHADSAIRDLISVADDHEYLACTSSPDASRILLSATHSHSTSLQALIYDTTSGSLLHSLPGGTVRVRPFTTGAAVAWSTTGCIAVGSAEGVKVWDLGDLSSDLSPRLCLVPPEGESGEMKIDALAFSPSGAEVAASMDPSSLAPQWRVCVFNAKTGACLHNVAKEVSTLNFSSDGTELHSDKGVIWRREDAEPGTQEPSEMVRASDPRLTYSLSEDEKWIMDRQGRKVCRLSFEVKWGTFSAHGSHVAFTDKEHRPYVLHLTPLDS